MLHLETARPKEPQADAAWSNAQRIAILAETDRILADPTFKNSKRCVALLSCLIEHVLDGDLDGIKERTLAIEVFGRDANYDTNADPIVRMTANEIRKRLAQYYQALAVHHELKIHLIPGTYIPRFEFETAGQNSTATEEAIPKPAPGPVELSAPVLAHMEETRARQDERICTWKKWVPWAAGGLLAMCTTVAVLLANSYVFRSTQYLLWAPIVESVEPATICMGDFTALPNTDRSSLAQSVVKLLLERRVLPTNGSGMRFPQVPFVDVDVAARMTGYLTAHHKTFTMRRETTITLEDLRRGPAVMVGAFDNSWALFLLSKMRFRVQIDESSGDLWVEDAQNLSLRDWKVNSYQGYGDSQVDYAIVTRFLDPNTGQWVLSAAGLGLHGTEAAGELLTDPAFDKVLPPALRSARKNFQIVLKTTVVDGHTGLPQIVAVYTW